jgi:hypothetical protein
VWEEHGRVKGSVYSEITLPFVTEKLSEPSVCLGTKKTSVGVITNFARKLTSRK